MSQSICLKGKVLVVEDDCSVRGMILSTLSMCGLDVISASSGEEAVGIINPDLLAVVTDMHMLELTGNDVAAIAKKIRKTLPVLLHYSPCKLEPNKMLFDGIFLKPLDTRKMADFLKRI